MNKNIRLALAAVAAATLTGCGVMYAPGNRTVQIERTEYGIPHITAFSYEGLAYGTAYEPMRRTTCACSPTNW